jgi:hypothetical protein
MGEFQVPVDIANRGLQHIGQRKLDAVAGFTEQSKAARETSFAYGKLRRSELRSNTWRFAIKSACLRPVDSNTLLLAPSLWVSNATYFMGSVVADSANNLWVSQVPNNIGNPPTTASGTVVTPYWAPYFGPLTVGLYDSSQAYLNGELVYTAAGNGTYNTYMSLTGGNQVHPALPNQWSTQTAYFKNQVVQSWPAYASGTTYSKGQGVSYTDGNIYASLTNSNTGNAPPSSAANWALVPVLTLSSQTVPATTVVQAVSSSPVLEWTQATGYSQGNVVMFNASVYLSLVNNNIGNFPNASGSTSWVAVTNGALYMSMIDLNIGNTPSSSPANWASGTTYASGNQVCGSDGVIYTSSGNGNIGNNPTTDGGVHWTNTGTLCPWTTVFTQGGGNDQWIQIGGAAAPSGVSLTRLSTSIFPLGSGPTWQTWNKNAYRLPSGYLKRAPQDPKSGYFSWLGAPANDAATDWQFEGDYLVTRDGSPIVFRFVADITDVTEMDDQFCEMLGAKVGDEVCEALTQSTAKVASCQAAYKLAEFKAKTANAIETGSDDEPLDDYIACRA